MDAILIGLAILAVISFLIHLSVYIYKRIQAVRNPPQQLPDSSALMMHFGATCLVIILIALLIPQNLKYASKYPQSEVKTNLGAIYVAQLSYFSENNTYAGGSDTFKLINWEPASQNRYAYYCQGAMIPNKLPMRVDYVPKPDGRWPVTAKPQSSQSGFTCMAVGNIDNDDTLDVWSINDSKILRNDLNDI